MFVVLDHIIGYRDGGGNDLAVNGCLPYKKRANSLVKVHVYIKPIAKHLLHNQSTFSDLNTLNKKKLIYLPWQSK